MAAMEKNNKNLNVPNLRFPEFSGEWDITTIGEISNIKNGPFGSVLHAEDYVSDGIPIVTTEHFKSGSLPIVKDGIPQVSEQDYIRLKGYKLQTNDIVISRVGSVDINAYVSDTQNGWLFSGRVLRVRPISSVNSLCLHFVLSTEKVKQGIRSRAVGQTMPSINTPILSTTNIFLPKSLEEQRKISIFLALIDARLETQKKIIEKYESIIRGLYHSVFNQPASTLQLKDVVSVVKGLQVNGEELLEYGKYYVMNGGTEPSGYLNVYNTPANTISISEGGNSCGYVQYNTEPFWSGGHCYSLIQKGQSVNYQYLYHFLKYKERNIMALRIGSGLPNIQKKDLERFEIRVLPTKQQNRVAEILEDMSAKCNLEKRILQGWQCQKSHLLRYIFI